MKVNFDEYSQYSSEPPTSYILVIHNVDGWFMVISYYSHGDLMVISWDSFHDLVSGDFMRFISPDYSYGLISW